MKLFDVEGPIYKMMESLMNVFLVSLCFWITCVPIVTAGAGLVAACDVSMKMVDGEEGYVFKQFWKSFKSNIKQGIILELITLLCAYVVYLDFEISDAVLNGSFMLMCLGMVSAFMFVCSLIYAYPQVARYENKLSMILRNSFRISLKYFVRTLFTVIAMIVEFLAFMWNTMLIFIGFIIGPGCIIYTLSYTAKKTFLAIEKSRAAE